MLIWSYWPAAQGGAERQCRLISPYLARKGIEVRVLTARLRFSTPSQEQDGAVSLERLGGPWLPLILGAQRLMSWPWTRRLQAQPALAFWVHLPFTWLARLVFMLALALRLRKNHPPLDLLHAHESGWLGALAVRLGASFRLPVVCKVATYPPFPCIGWDVPGAAVLRRVQRQGFLLALNTQVQKELLEVGCAPCQVSLLPNAVQVPEEQAQPEQATKVLYVGNLSQGAALKGFDLLFAAWAQVAPLLPQVQLLVAGAGDDRPWRAEVEGLGCKDSVHFQGFVADLSPLYRQAALLILPSRVEGMSNALLEAMSWGLPVLASDIVGNRAVVRSGENGLLVPPQVEALAEALLDLMKSPERRKSMGTAGRQLMQEQFHPELLASRLVQCYTRLV
jgi:glycosyltransferase involved in cell wall biosynthesis